MKIINKREFLENLYQENYEDLSEDDLNIIRSGRYDNERYCGKCFCCESLVYSNYYRYCKVLTTVAFRPDCVTALCFSNPPEFKLRGPVMYEDGTITGELLEEECGAIGIMEMEVADLETWEWISEEDFVEAMQDFYAHISDADMWRNACEAVIGGIIIG